MTTQAIIESGMTFGPYPVGQCFYIEKSQCCFTRTLCMPDNTFFHAIFQFCFNGLGRKVLGIAHGMLLELNLTLIISFFHVNQAISEHKK